MGKIPFRKHTAPGSGRQEASQKHGGRHILVDGGEHSVQGTLDNHTKSQAKNMNTGKSGKGPVKRSDLHNPNAKSVLGINPGKTLGMQGECDYGAKHPLAKKSTHGASYNDLERGYSGR